MGESLTTVVGIFLAAILMFIFPLMSIADRNDDIAQLGVQTATIEFVDNIRTTGKITSDNYDAFYETLAATGNTYDVDMEIKHLDDNPGKKAAWVDINKIGENIYYSEYNSQIEDALGDERNNNTLLLKEGDIISVNVKNTNTTISQMLRNFFYTISGADNAQIIAKHSGMVQNNGTYTK